MNLENRNKGFSLIELIITIAIMGIVTGAAVSIYSSIKTHRVTDMAENIDDCLSELRTETLTKNNSYSLEIKKDGDKIVGVIYRGTSEHQKKTITTVGEVFSHTVSGSECEIKDGNLIEIVFKKSGAIQTMRYKNTATGSVEDINGKIEVKYSDKSKAVNISKLTGKHYVE